jgi:hypothetical protein
MRLDEITKKLNENHRLIEEQMNAGYAVVETSEEEAKAYVRSVSILLLENIELILERHKLNQH